MDSSAARTCEACGANLVNPLVAQGLVPQSMADILMPPAAKSQQRKANKRVVTDGRVISGQEMLIQLKEKEAEEERKKNEKIMREKMRESKREERKKIEEEKEVKRRKREDDRQKKREEKRQKTEERDQLRQERQRKREVGGKLADKMYTCGHCNERGRVNDERNGVMWYGCDEERCKRWFHWGCMGERERRQLEESMDDGSNWYCTICKPWLYVEE